MSFTKIAMGILLGAGFSGIMLSLAYYFIAITDTTSSNPIGDARDWKWVILAIGAIIGAVLGGVSGGIIAGLQASFPKAVIIGFVLNLVLSMIFFVWSGGPMGNHFLKYSMISMIIAGVISAAMVSLLVSGKSVPYR